MFIYLESGLFFEWINLSDIALCMVLLSVVLSELIMCTKNGSL